MAKVELKQPIVDEIKAQLDGYLCRPYPDDADHCTWQAHHYREE